MRWNPFVNALAAAAYIWGVGWLMDYITVTQQNTPYNIVDPIAAISLVVFSAAFMAFLFFYRPVVFLIENKKEEAISFFLKTLATFGLLALIAFSLVLR